VQKLLTIRCFVLGAHRINGSFCRIWDNWKSEFFLGPTMFIATCKQHVALFIYSKIPWPKWEMVE